MVWPRLVPAGEAALLVEFGDTIDPATNRRVHDLLAAVEAARFPEILDLVPTYRSLLVSYDATLTTFAALGEKIRSLDQRGTDAPHARRRVVEIPTCYGGSFGPDLSFVADYHHLAPAEVIEIHAGTDYLVYMMGFSPGFTYLGGMSERIATPRLKTPRTAIPAGSVGIAQQQTGIYPVESPGGWQLIGRTPVTLFDPSRVPPVVVEAGDFIRFVPVAEGDYARIERDVRQRRWSLTVHEVET
jgi:inhibitor of KinA